MKMLKDIKINIPADIRKQYDEYYFVSFYSFETLQKELAQLINIEELCKRSPDIKIVNYVNNSVWLLLVVNPKSLDVDKINTDLKFLEENVCLNVDKYLNILNQLNS